MGLFFIFIIVIVIIQSFCYCYCGVVVVVVDVFVIHLSIVLSNCEPCEMEACLFLFSAFLCHLNWKLQGIPIICGILLFQHLSFSIIKLNKINICFYIFFFFGSICSCSYSCVISVNFFFFFLDLILFPKNSSRFFLLKGSFVFPPKKRKENIYHSL